MPKGQLAAANILSESWPDYTLYARKAEYTYSGNKANHGGLKYMKLDNKALRRYENVNDEEHCVVNIFEKYLSKPRCETSSSTSALFQTMGQVFQDLVTSLLDKISYRKSSLMCVWLLEYKGIKLATQGRWCDRN